MTVHAETIGPYEGTVAFEGDGCASVALIGAQRQALDREAPERLVVPSGCRHRVQYERGMPPVLAVRIQEMLGLAETPRLGRGRVPVLLHLLAPSYWPEQETSDLARFCREAYHVVSKGLRLRYPMHSWPEDPPRAKPEAKWRR